MRFCKIITIVCLFIFVISISTAVHADQAIIETDQLNVRTGPGTHFDKIGQVNTNEEYPIIQIEGDWVEIEIGDRSGWITVEYITIEQQSEETGVENAINIQEDKEQHEPQNIHTEITISNENTQVRQGPSVDEEIIMFAKEGQHFEIISENNDWYEITTDQGPGYIFKKLIDHQQRNDVNHLENKTIVIDAGHGGHDVGAIGINGTYEKTFTLMTASELATTLKTLGANVVLTRHNDDYIRLASRPMLANIHHADAFLSIHYNSFTDLTTVDGIDTYYYHDDDQDFAKVIQNELVYATNADNRGIHYGDFQVLRQNHQPSLLLELGFISNSEKEQLLSTNGYQRKLVKGIATGLEKYFSVSNSQVSR